MHQLTHISRDLLIKVLFHQILAGCHHHTDPCTTSRSRVSENKAVLLRQTTDTNKCRQLTTNRLYLDVVPMARCKGAILVIRMATNIRRRELCNLDSSRLLPREPEGTIAMVKVVMKMKTLVSSMRLMTIPPQQQVP